MIGIKYKGKRAGQRLFQHSESCIIYGFYIVGYVAQIIADKGEICLFRFNISDLANCFNCLMIGNIATEAVNRVGRVDDYSAFAQYFNNLFYGFRVWIFRVDFYKHYFLFRISDFLLRIYTKISRCFGFAQLRQKLQITIPKQKIQIPKSIMLVLQTVR